MKKNQILVVALIGILSFIFITQCISEPPKPLTTETYLAHIKFLADPKLEGRMPDTDGCRKAGKYIAEKLKSYGVLPLGDNGSFFQKVSWDWGGKKVKSRNVIGIITGADKDLRNEAILLLAHYDHLGNGVHTRGKNRGKIHPGANDNASGVAALLEAARAIKERKLKPKRSMIFLATTGEELGLYGSKYYVDHPTFPLEKTQVAINIDQVGEYDRGLAAMGVHMSPLFDNALDAALKGAGIRIYRQKIAGRGDNMSFNDRFIPSLFFWTGYGDHYHKPSDTVKNINGKKGAEITEIIIKLALYLADAKKIETGLPRSRGSYRPFIGIGYDARSNGLLITAVVDDSPADKAGLKEDDIITALAGNKFESENSLSEILLKYKVGDTVEVDVKRGKKTLKLKITLGKR